MIELKHGWKLEHYCELRDYFAVKALTIAYEFFSKDYYNEQHPDADVRRDDVFDFGELDMQFIAERAYAMADAMLKERDK